MQSVAPLWQRQRRYAIVETEEYLDIKRENQHGRIQGTMEEDNCDIQMRDGTGKAKASPCFTYTNEE